MPSTSFTPTAILVTAFGYNLAIISEADWNRWLGPHGVAAISILAVIALWVNGLRERRLEENRRTREEQARDRRHGEVLALYQDNSEKLANLTVENAKVNMRVAQAINNMDRTIQRIIIKEPT